MIGFAMVTICGELHLQPDVEMVLTSMKLYEVYCIANIMHNIHLRAVYNQWSGLVDWTTLLT